jgi:allantoinase
MKVDLAIKSKNILTPSGMMDGYVLISDGKISDVVTAIPSEINFDVDDVGESVVMPGVIDPHVHINEPGRTDWEGFNTATRAAAAGGVTTLIEMPLNASPVTTTKNNFQLKLDATKNQLHVNCGFWGGVVPDNYNDLEELLQSGVFGLKAFLTHSGIDEFPNTTNEHLHKALLLLKKYNKPLLVHCELDALHSGLKLLEDNPDSYVAYMKSRPPIWEDNAIKRMIVLCRETGARVHIVHLSSANTLDLIRKAKEEGLPLTVETAQHYLFFTAEKIPDGGTEYKCAPPIRQKANNELLWEALLDGTIDFVATDHSPAPPEMKEIASGNFMKAWGGIAGLQFALSALWTKASMRKIPLTTIAKWLCENPAKFTQLSTKGKIEKNFDADIVVWDPNKKFIVKESNVQHKHKLTPYLNLGLSGVIEQTYVGGIKVFDNGNFIHLNQGKILKK